ncbi:MAG: carbohydrate ABC transporter permease [Lachnospiraceae bacterium]
MAAKNRKKIKVSKVFIYIFLSILVVIYLAPLFWIVTVAFKTNAEVMRAPFALPESWNFVNFQQAWEKAKLGVALKNSTIVCGVTLVISLLFGSMAAFAIGRMRWKLSGAAMTYFLIGMMIPVHCVLIPLFVQFSKIGLTNSLISIIIPYVTFSLPITIYIMVGFFKSMPSELFEAACIDGCSIYRCFFTIALPLSKTGLFVTGLMTFVGNWNELLLAMVFISDKMKKTLPVTLSYFAAPYKTNYVQMFAAIIIAILPNVVVYCMFSNQIVEGLTVGAVKG